MRQRRRSDCPIHFGLEVFGDTWTLLLVRDLMFKDRATYTDFLHGEERIATNILAARLAKLERDGVVTRDAAQRYHLTDRGLDLLPVLVEIIVWGAAHDAATAADPLFVARAKSDRVALIAEIRAAHLARRPR